MMYRWYLPETTKAIWEMWERTGAKEVSDTQEARRIEEDGGLAFVNHSKNPRRRKRGFEFTYIEPILQDICQATRAWYRIRGEVMRNTISIAVAAEDGPFWVREIENGFMQNTAPDVLVKYEPLEDVNVIKKQEYYR